MESRKMVLMNLFAGQELTHRCREGFVDTAVEGENGMNFESIIEIYTFPSVK